MSHIVCHDPYHHRTNTIYTYHPAHLSRLIASETFNRFKYLCQESGATAASVGHNDQVEVLVREGLGQDVERPHLHEDEVSGQPELGDVEEGALVRAVDITVRVCHQECHVSAVLADTEQTDLLLTNKNGSTRGKISYFVFDFSLPHDLQLHEKRSNYINLILVCHEGKVHVTQYLTWIT